MLGTVVFVSTMGVAACSTSAGNGEGPPDGTDAADAAEESLPLDSSTHDTEATDMGCLAPDDMEPANAIIEIDQTTGLATHGSFDVKSRCTGEDITASITCTVDDPRVGSFTRTGPGNCADFAPTTSLPPGSVGMTTRVHAQPGGASATLTIIALAECEGECRSERDAAGAAGDEESKDGGRPYGCNARSNASSAIAQPSAAREGS